MLIGVATLVGGTAFAMTGTGNAGQGAGNQLSSAMCDDLANALASNRQFIADERANPNPNSRARIANRRQVIDLLKVQLQAEGCNRSGRGQDFPPDGPQGGGDRFDPSPDRDADPSGRQQGSRDAGQVVCPGSTVTLSGEGGPPAASSGQFPIGTKLNVTNLDNNRSITVEVNSPSGSCVLLNNAAFEQVREPGKFLIRKALIERLG